jgi:hypothetical protein
MRITRRAFLAGSAALSAGALSAAAAVAGAGVSAAGAAPARPTVTVHKSPT